MGYICIMVVLALTVCSLNFELLNNKYIFFSIYVILLILLGFSYDLPDYRMYKGFYDGSIKLNMDDLLYGNNLGAEYSRDLGYTISSYIFNILGFDFFSFRLIVYLICLFVIFIISYRCCKNYILIIGLYTLYPLIIDDIQLRNFVMEVVLFGTMYLYSSCKQILKKSFIWIFMILIASSFHSAALALLCFFIFDLCLDTKFRYIMYVFVVIGLAMPLYANYMQENFLVLKYIFLSMDSSMRHYAIYTEREVIRKHLTCYLFLISSYIYMRFLVYMQSKFCFCKKNFNKVYINTVKNSLCTILFFYHYIQFFRIWLLDFQEIVY